MIVIPENIQTSYSSILEEESDTYTVSQIPISIQTKIDQLFQYLKSPNNIPLPIKDHVLPPGILYADNDIFVYEKPPCLKNYFYINSQLNSIEDQTPEVYTIPLPWQVYVVLYGNSGGAYYISDIYMYFSNSSITSFDQSVYLAPLTNFYTNGLLCRPMFDNMEEITPRENNLNSLIELSYNWVWNSGFNADLTESMLQTYIYGYAREEPVFPDLQHLKVNPSTSYYLQSSSHVNVLESWQKVPLEEVLNVKWFPPSQKSRYYSDYNNFMRGGGGRQSFQEWLIDTSPQSVSTDTSCCENCQYYDEDGEPEYGVCVEDGECSCHDPEYNFNIDQVYAYLKQNNFFDRNVSLRQILQELLEKNVSQRTYTQIDFLNSFYDFSI